MSKKGVYQTYPNTCYIRVGFQIQQLLLECDTREARNAVRYCTRIVTKASNGVVAVVIFAPFWGAR